LRRKLILLGMTGLFLFSATRTDAQIFHHKKKINKSTSPQNNADPDKILYDKAIEDIKHGRHEVGRLNLQTLINTYPDSEYLAKAKLGIADSFFKEGGSANMTQAVQAYNDFNVFFPMLPEAAYAQLQVAMAHYRQMEKPDRDRTQAREAEDAFQTFLTKYPNDPLAPKAEQHLREVQEVLAEGDFRIGYYYYYGRDDKKAAESRLRAVVNRYPLYSKADRALWMLGDIWGSTEKKELAAPFYARIVRDYPLSPYVPDAKAKLKALGSPIPQPDAKAVDWMTAERNAPRQHETLIKKPLAMVNTRPKRELQVAATLGKPTMVPGDESDAGTDILTAGNQSRIGGTGSSIVATVVTGGANAGNVPADGAENVAPASPGGDSGNGAPADPNAAAPADPNAPAPADAGNGAAANGAADAAAKSDAAAKADAAAPSADGQASDASKADAAQSQDPAKKNANADSKKESSSKKKKGLRKIIPW